MNRKRMIGYTMLLFTLTIFFWGCPPPVVGVRPPEPRIEFYGDPPHPEAIWKPGHWAYKRGEWVWIPGRWIKRPRPHAQWVPGHWEPRGGGWIWIEGHWRYR